MTIAPIPTRYAGCHFRSRLEARWAVVFDQLGYVWEYEREGYALMSGWYLPDFWLPGPRCWIEIKPLDTVIDPRWCELIDILGGNMYIFYGTPGVSGKRGFITKGPSSGVYDFSDGLNYPMCDIGLGTSNVNDIIRAAYDAARSARFEYGQSGA